MTRKATGFVAGAGRATPIFPAECGRLPVVSTDVDVSLAEILAALPEPDREAVLDALAPADMARLRYDWSYHARPKQLAPDGDWTTWLVLAGRGWGKTRALTEWCRERIEVDGCRFGAFVAPTAADVRDVLVEGPSGILAVSRPSFRPEYEPSKRKLTWPNGAEVHLYSADEPDRLRGPQHEFAGCDEIAAWRYPIAWDMLMFGLRMGARPRVMATTTPRPVALLKDLLRDGTCIVTRGTTYENMANLAEAFVRRVIHKYEGTRLGRQELLAEILDEVPGALWTLGLIDRLRVPSVRTDWLARVVVAVDPPATSPKTEQDRQEEERDGPAECGIVVCGRGGPDPHEPHGYVLEDASRHATPLQWASIAIALYHHHQADCIVAEANQGGEMVEHTIHSVDTTVPVKLVHATRGKLTRAEPIASLTEKGRIHHVGVFPKLEDQQSTWVPGNKSPDRMDAMVWGMTELFVGVGARRVEVW